MATTLGLVLDNLGERLDEDLLPAIYTAASIPTAEVRAWMDEVGIPYVDREAGRQPAAADIEAAADRLVCQARDRATVLGAASGFVGAVAVPPEVLGSVVQALRLGQRLAVLHGIDPETDAGKLVLWRAIAAYYEVELPEGLVGLRVRDVPDLVKAQLPAPRQATLWLTRQVVQRTLTSIVGRIGRLVPGLGAGMGAASARKRAVEGGQRMLEIYRKVAEGVPFDLGDVENAVEVKGARPATPG